MKQRVSVFPALAICWCMLFTPIQKIQAQPEPGKQKLEELAKVLGLTPRQKIRLAPILEAEAPKVKAIKENPSMPKLEKVERLKAIHQESDPEVKAILNPQQYQMFQEIRQKEIEEAVEKKS